MEIVHSDSVFKVLPGQEPEYDIGNSLVHLLGVVEKVQFAADREHYLAGSAQYLIPFSELELFSPSAPHHDNVDPKQQDDKHDFQKQNIRNFTVTDTVVVRGWASVGSWFGPYVKLSYMGGPDSILAAKAGTLLGNSIQVHVVIQGVDSGWLNVPFNRSSGCYEIELWGYPANDLADHLGGKGKESLAAGRIAVRPDLVRGQYDDFLPEKLKKQDGKPMDVRTVAPDHSMHPVKALRLEVEWRTSDTQFDDKVGNAPYIYEFNMIVRGWEQFLAVGESPNPHGGVGLLEFRNLLSNYREFKDSKELGRDLEAWNFDAHGTKHSGGAREEFLAVDYMDLHLLRPYCGIGLHRHRDNQEVFLMMEGQSLMVVGDWCKFPNRERCFEIRTLKAGHFAMLKGGNLHGLMNLRDEDARLFMFGGYD